MARLTLFFLATFLLSGSAWLVHKPLVQPFSRTRKYSSNFSGIEKELASQFLRQVTADEKKLVSEYESKLTADKNLLKTDLIIPGITIPMAGIQEQVLKYLTILLSTDAELVIFAILAQASGIEGTSKSDSRAFDKLQDIYITNVITNKNELPKGYKYFGNGDVKEILKQLLFHNPFFTSALQSKGGSWSINTYASQGDETRYSKLLKAYDPDFPRVNVKLNSDFDVIDYKVVDGNGKDIPGLTKEKAVEHLLFSLIYYAEVIHASMHIYNYISVIGLFLATRLENFWIRDWGRSYLANVAFEYSNVESLLFNVGGALVGGGFLADRNQVLKYVRDDLLKPWLHYSTSEQFIDQFIFASIPKDQRKGLIPEFLKQTDLIPNFARDLDIAVTLTTQFDGALSRINNELSDYYHRLGDDISNLKSMDTWVQLMSVIGIFHGCTFSFTRYAATPQFLPYLDFKNKGSYTADDKKNVITFLATTSGLDSGRHVFNSKIVDEGNPINGVLKTYDARSYKIKTEYFDSIKKNPKFSDYGWIWTDFGPDRIDNKQLTLTTYV